MQTGSTAGNQIVAYDRAGDGTLTQADTYSTGGLGGQTVGSAADHLSSQGSLAYDRQGALLFAVNAGSSTVSVFGVRGDHLSLDQVIGSGGTFPVTVAVHGDLVYVLNAENGGSVQGYRVFFGRLFPVPGSARPLGLDPAATPQFTHTPGQVAFSPDGSKLIVTTKANGNDIDVFGVRAGSLPASPVVNSEPSTVPFGVTPGGSLTEIGSVTVPAAAAPRESWPSSHHGLGGYGATDNRHRTRLSRRRPASWPRLGPLGQWHRHQLFGGGVPRHRPSQEDSCGSTMSGPTGCLPAGPLTHQRPIQTGHLAQSPEPFSRPSLFLGVTLDRIAPRPATPSGAREAAPLSRRLSRTRCRGRVNGAFAR